ncbi:MAG: hypothetical protein NUV56_03855, partial [Candidatus Uhrbacteria bacterium]|nr:hypothetical protein [Candidatus Uhrbacteria bacterium]
MIGLAAIVPLIAFPWTIDTLDINKQTVAIVLIVLAAVTWLGAMLVRREAQFRATWLYVPLAAFVGSSLLSTFFSLAPYVSLVGQGGQEYTSTFSIVAFAVFFILGTHVFSPRGVQRNMWALFLVSSACVALLSTLAWFGISFDVIPTNIIGTPNSLAIFLVTASLLGAGLWLTSGGDEDVLPSGFFGAVVRGAIIVTSLVALVVLLAVDYVVLWTVALVGVLILFTFALARAREFPLPGRFVIPMLFFVVSLLFMFLPSVIRSPLPTEVAPTYSTSWDIASQNLEDSSTLLGSGPGTFVIGYTKFQPVTLNTTAFWDTRFDRGASHVLTMLSTFGVLGTVAFGLFVLFLGTLVIVRLVREKDHAEWKLTFAPFAAWAMLVVGMVLYAQNFTLAFLFWTLSAVL